MSGLPPVQEVFNGFSPASALTGRGCAEICIDEGGGSGAGGIRLPDRPQPESAWLHRQRSCSDMRVVNGELEKIWSSAPAKFIASDPGA